MPLNTVNVGNSGHPTEDAYHEAKRKFSEYLQHMDSWMRENNMPDIYVGTNGIQITPNSGNPSNNYVNPTNKPTAYTANAAGTASSIKQGGMTKDEIIEFNIRHPNETMIRGQ